MITYDVLAAYWTLFLRARPELAAKPHEVAEMLALMKLARCQQGRKNRDDYIDLLGYGAIVGELRLATTTG